MKKMISRILSVFIIVFQFNMVSAISSENIDDKNFNDESITYDEDLKNNLEENIDTDIEDSIDNEHKEEISVDTKFNEDTKDNQNIMENGQYEVINKPVSLTYTQDSEMKEEMKADFDSLKDLKYLVLKTDSEYEVVMAHSNGTYTYLDKSDNLNDAINKADDLNSKQKSSELMTAVINKNGQIIYSPMAMGKIIKYINGSPYPNKDKNTNLYTEADLKNAYTYINHGYVDDVPIIEDRGTVAKIQLSSYKGWINKNSADSEFDMIVVPLNQVKNPSYYKNVNGDLIHFISSDITSSKEVGHSINIGKTPNFMSQGVKYYSYDGQYLYSNLESLIYDLEEDTNKRSINSGSEFYSYYLNLPFRSRTVFTSAELDEFINKKTESNSKLRGIGSSLKNAEQKYGVNALITLGIAINESNWGKSSIAQSKNNIFGINAVDSNPGQAANQFATVEDCINEFAKNYISKGYADPQDWRYKGAHLGNKNLGANVKYASDPFWGEKAANHMHSVDKELSKNKNLREYNSKIIASHYKPGAVTNKNNDIIYEIKKGDSANSGKLGSTIIVNSFGKDTLTYNVNGHRNTSVSLGEFHGEYNWDDNMIIKSNELKIINSDMPRPTKGINYNSYVEGLGWQEVKSNGQLSGTSGESKRIEAIKIDLNEVEGVNFKYRVHIQDYGWQDWKNKGEIAGISGSGKRIEAIEFKMDDNSKYELKYRTHVQDYGWQNWKVNSGISGTVGNSKRIEGIEIKIEEKKTLTNLKYQTHVQNEDWQNWKLNDQVSGTVGQSKRLEAIKISIDGLESNTDLKYRVHVQDEGWQDWKNNNQIAGTTGKFRRLEAIEIKLDEKYKDKYSIEYRVHVQDEGWQGWKKDSQLAGTTGKGKRLEAIQIRLIKK